MNDLRHVSNRRLDRIEFDARGRALTGDAGSWEASTAIADTRREKIERDRGHY